MATVDDVLYTRLAGGSAITTIVGSAIYRGFREQETAMPCVTFFRVDTTPVNGALDASGTERARFQVDSWSTSQRTARTLADAVKARLSGWVNEASPATSPCLLILEQDLTEDTGEGGQPVARVSQDYAIWYSAS